jgi:hypothetical protein
MDSNAAIEGSVSARAAEVDRLCICI